MSKGPFDSLHIYYKRFFLSMGNETLVSKTKANPFTLKRRKFLSRHNIWCYNIWCHNIWCHNIWCNNIWGNILCNNIWGQYLVLEYLKIQKKSLQILHVISLCFVSVPNIVFRVPPIFFLEFYQKTFYGVLLLGYPQIFSRPIVTNIKCLSISVLTQEKKKYLNF